MNRKILIEETRDGRFVVSTNYGDRRAVGEMCVVTIIGKRANLSRALDRVIEGIPAGPPPEEQDDAEPRGRPEFSEECPF